MQRATLDLAEVVWFLASYDVDVIVDPLHVCVSPYRAGRPFPS